ncbi:MAG: peptidoglycan -binding protein [Alphaproteobacteria bacterium]|nr:peptidoglycan -binding protein [Alphaproteobacteria bacterium]MBM3950432.1 peptidoglycan -binding protein [Rhodospirillales bacterium]
MALASRRPQRDINIWPGFVDALTTLLLALVFLLTIFVLAQFFLGEALLGRDNALRRLQDDMSAMAELLSLERKENQNLRANMAQITQELEASVALRDELTERTRALGLRLGDTERELKAARDAGDEANARAAKLAADIAALTALRDELEKKAAGLAAKVETADKNLIEERKVSESARAQVALLNRQMAALREQLARLNEALEASEKLSADQKVQITALGSRLNAALAGKVQELSRYRSEFFGRLREVLGEHPDIRIVGDRFVFQSEVLFETGSADIGAAGAEQLGRLAGLLTELTGKIPPDIDWVLRIDGHTDRVPISTARFPSNWELSSARALSVLRFLMARGVPPHRLAAAGFGEFHPLDERRDEIAYRRNRRIEIKLTER